MFRRIINSLLIINIILFLSISASAQMTIDDILYSDLKEIESFGYIHVKVQGERAAIIGLSNDELTDYAKLKYKNNFIGIEFKEIAVEESSLYQEDSEAKKVGSVWFRIWVAGEGNPIAYYIECKAGNYIDYELWNDEILGLCNERDIKQICRNEINRMIENLAITFFKVRGEI